MFERVIHRFKNILEFGANRANSNLSPFIVLDDGVVIDASVKVFHFTVIRSNVKIGPGTVIGHNVVVERDTIIGKNVTIQSQCHITAEAVIGDNVFFGPSVVTMNERVIANQGRAVPKIERLVIGNGARIGAGAVLAPGVNIGANSFIQAGVFVTKDVPEGEVWGHRNDKAKAVRLRKVPREEWL